MPIDLKPENPAQNGRAYVTYAPTKFSIRLTGSGGTRNVRLTSRATTRGGGEAVFFMGLGVGVRGQAELTLPVDASWTTAYIAGKFGKPSREDQDCEIVAEILESGERSVFPIMVRIRKDANTLTASERDRFLTAYGVVNAAGIYQDFCAMHVDEARDEAHFGPQFLPWHRAYLLDLERELQAVDPTVALHYWRFDQPAPNVFTADFMGATRRVVPGRPADLVRFTPGNPLERWTSDGVPGVVRSARFDPLLQEARPRPNTSVLSQAQTLALGIDYASFKDMEGQPHGAAHVSFDGFIGSIPTAPKDPLFFLLHSNVDRLWALWQWVNRRIDQNDVAAYQGEDLPPGRRVLDSMWPWNNVLTSPRPDFAPRGSAGLRPSPTATAPGARPTVGSMIDAQGHLAAATALGFGYDDVPYDF